MRIRMGPRYPPRWCRSITSAAVLVRYSAMLRNAGRLTGGRAMTYCVGIWTQRRPRDGVRLPHQRGPRPGQRRAQDAHLRPAGRAGVHPAQQRQPLVHPVDHHPAPARLRPGQGAGPGPVALRRGPGRSASRCGACPTWTATRSSATTSSSTSTSCWAARCAGSRPASSSSTRRATRCRPARTRRISRSARPSTAGPSSTAASASTAPRSKRRRSTRCSRSTRRCART